MTEFLDWLADAADRRAARGLTRRLHTTKPGDLLDLAGNDYLGLRTDPRVIAAAVAGAGDDVTLDGVQFALADPLPVEDRARELACADAARTAAHLARLPGASLGPLRSVSDGAGSSPMPVFARTAAYDAQVQPGSVEATVTVSVVFDLSFDDSP